ncbi:hypothetical protein PACTADRAFT_324 [Pachysolen tannophilus NRRL Y-2460]|uniref:Major facilitator superfamily (MFS) profile domain-containing protein n=1 Tax=Pachysolen tannophilus NRRL Y-2460 TaxID=669874 RepID=A0A1E4U1D8_PACTA|nr:hypothetical protein PACTADRAFT_324 [Pachysolen tannophilus NRRL Y-2460]
MVLFLKSSSATAAPSANIAKTNFLTDFYDKFPKTYNMYIIAFVSTIGGLMFGFDISSVSSFLSQEYYLKFFDSPDTITQGGISASMAGGSFIGSLIASYISDPLGRRVSLQVSSMFWMIGAAIQSSSQNRAQLICGRFISGFGIGISSSTAPSYVSEISPKKIRGTMGGIFQWSVTIGIMVMFFIGYGCTFIDGVGSFRLAWGLQIVPGAMLFVGVPFLPESPRWLANHGQWSKAEDIVARINSKGDLEDPEVIIELKEIKEQVLIDEDAKDVTFAELFNKTNIKRTTVGMCGQMWQQMCGMNVMMYYIVYIFEMAGYTGNTNLVASSIQYVIFVVMTAPALFFLDKVGRRPLLLIGAVLMAAFLFAVGAILAVYSEPTTDFDGNENITISIPDSNKAAAKALIACSYLFVATFGPTWGPGIWLYCSEIFPNRIRAKANGVSTSVNWIFNFALGMFVPTAFHNISWKTYMIFGTFCVVAFFNVYFLFPETQGKTLEEIDQMWQDGVPAWRTKNYVVELPPLGEVFEEKASAREVENASSDDNATVDETRFRLQSTERVREVNVEEV